MKRTATIKTKTAIPVEPSGLTMINIDEMSGEQFEDFFAEVLQQLGYHVQTTRATGDGGADILATSPRGTLWAVQCKRQEKNVSVAKIRELLGAVQIEHRGRRPWLATTSFLTAPASKVAIRSGMRVTNRDSLFELLDEIEGIEAANTSSSYERTTIPRPRRIIRTIAALVTLGGCTAFMLHSGQSKLTLPGRNCTAGYACMYTADGFSSSEPEHKYYSYGCYNLYDELGIRYILNSQTSGAEVILYNAYDCSDMATTIRSLNSWHGEINPIYSILITPRQA